MSLEFKQLNTATEFQTTIPLLLEANGGDPKLDPEEMTRQFLIAAEHDYRHFGIYKEGELIGTFSLSLRYNPTFYAPGCELNGLIVAAEHRSKGIGEKAMDFAAGWARDNGAGFLRLFVYPANAGAMSFYQRLGFKHTSNYMWKNLL